MDKLSLFVEHILGIYFASEVYDTEYLIQPIVFHFFIEL